jgi:hypothetical protein
MIQINVWYYICIASISMPTVEEIIRASFISNIWLNNYYREVSAGGFNYVSRLTHLYFQRVLTVHLAESETPVCFYEILLCTRPSGLDWINYWNDVERWTEHSTEKDSLQFVWAPVNVTWPVRIVRRLPSFAPNFYVRVWNMFYRCFIFEHNKLNLPSLKFQNLKIGMLFISN